MVDVNFEFRSTGQADDSAFLDGYEVTLMFDTTRAQITRLIEEKLGNLRCEEHGEPPRVTVIGEYSYETEQLDIQYHIDGCCNLLVMQAIQALNF
jgi:hypothetical protein